MNEEKEVTTVPADKQIVGFTDHPDHMTLEMADGSEIKVPHEVKPDIETDIGRSMTGYTKTNEGIIFHMANGNNLRFTWDQIIDAYMDGADEEKKRIEAEQKRIDEAKEANEIIILGVNFDLTKQLLTFKLSNGADLFVTGDEIVKFYTQIKEGKSNNSGLGGVGLGALLSAFAGGMATPMQIGDPNEAEQCTEEAEESNNESDTDSPST